MINNGKNIRRSIAFPHNLFNHLNRGSLIFAVQLNLYSSGID
jgi:hypothetical protein